MAVEYLERTFHGLKQSVCEITLGQTVVFDEIWSDREPNGNWVGDGTSITFEGPDVAVLAHHNTPAPRTVLLIGENINIALETLNRRLKRSIKDRLLGKSREYRWREGSESGT